MPSTRSSHVPLHLCWIALFLLFNAPDSFVKALQQLIDELRVRLAIPVDVEVKAAVLASNPLLVSVEASKPRRRGFVLRFQRAFLHRLDDDDLSAVVAHELGHVWIFTHHPYLQTERLANDVAMRVISRESLEKVYGKVWERGGAKGDLATFLGQ
jgi:hypothetical protein